MKFFKDPKNWKQEISGIGLTAGFIMKKYFSDKKNRRQLIIAGIITVFIALIPTIANIPVTYAEETSPDGKYKLVAQYPLLEELSCSFSIAGSGDQNGTLFLKSSDGKVLAQTAIVMHILDIILIVVSFECRTQLGYAVLNHAG